MSDNKIHIVLAVYDPRGTYSRHAGVVLVSIFSNTKSSVCVHILHDETLNEDNRSKFIELAEKFGQEINFIDAGEHIKKFRVDVDKLTGKFSRGTLFRLFIQDLLPVDKVIYLDCDVAVELDIKELWDTELNDCKVGAAIEYLDRHVSWLSKERLFFYRYAGIGFEKYFNAGVILFNLKKLREDNVNIYALALEFFRRYPYALFPDQDFLNKIFQESMREIDRKFNCFASEIDHSNINDRLPHLIGKKPYEDFLIKFFQKSVHEITRKFNYAGEDIDYSSMKGKIWHFVGGKPWELPTDLPTDALYWRYFAMTPWRCDLVTDMSEAWAVSLSHFSRFSHFRSSDCHKALWQRFKVHFSLRDRTRTRLYKIAVIWHDMIYRIRKRFGM